jgi:hypothetical protein
MSRRNVMTDPLAPLALLIAYAALVIPLGTTTVQLLVVMRPASRARALAMVMWVGTPALLAAIALETVRLVHRGHLPIPFAVLLIATSVALAAAYTLGANWLIACLEVERGEDEVRSMRSQMNDEAREKLLSFIDSQTKEPTVAQALQALLGALRRAL